GMVTVVLFGVVAFAAAVSGTFLAIGVIAATPAGLEKLITMLPPTVNGLVRVRNIAPWLVVLSAMRRTMAESRSDRSIVSGCAFTGCTASVTVADDTMIVGVPITLKTDDRFIATVEPAGDVIVMVTTSGDAPVMTP